MVDPKRIRDKFLMRSEIIYFNCGGLGPPIESVRNSRIEWFDIRDRYGPTSSVTEMILRRTVEKCRRNAAKLLNVKPEEIIFTQNTTEGVKTVLEAIDFRIDDEVLVTDMEHDTIYYCCNWAANKFGISIREVTLSDISKHPKKIVSKIVDCISSKTRLFIISHIAYNTGIRLPLKEIIKACKQKNQDTTVLVDGAHSFGHIEADLKDINCDFFASDGHKWLLGPEGSGLLYSKIGYLRGNTSNGIKIFSFKGFSTSFETTVKALTKSKIQHLQISKTIPDRYIELATIDATTVFGLNAAIEFLSQYGGGIKEIESRIKYLSGLLTHKLDTLEYVEILSPRDEHFQSGIVCFKIKGNESSEFTQKIVNELEKRNIVCRFIPRPICVRICIHYYNTEIDIELLIGALCDILEKYGGFNNKD